MGYPNAILMPGPSSGNILYPIGPPDAVYDPVKILTIHNRYKYRGGEDESREAEDAMLRLHGHEVREIVFDNAEITGEGDLLRIGLQATWSASSYRLVCDSLAAWKPDVLDVHNFFPLASPAVYYAARKYGVPVVQTLHNYRLFCPPARLCSETAVSARTAPGRLVPWPGGSTSLLSWGALQTGAVALMTTTHRLLGPWAETGLSILRHFAVLAAEVYRKRISRVAGSPEAEFRRGPRACRVRRRSFSVRRPTVAGKRN